AVSHPCPDTADQLVNEVAQRSAVRHASLDALGNQLAGLADASLAEAVLRALDRRPHATHAAVGFVAPALVDDHFARRLIQPGEQAAHHGATGAGGDRLRDVAAVADPAVGDD